jgi:DNA-binding NarL/FixJ family response regulator
VILLAALGCTTKEIAGRMRIADTTVKSHFVKIFGKLEVRSRTEAVSVAYTRGWLRSRHLVRLLTRNR